MTTIFSGSASRIRTICALWLLALAALAWPPPSPAGGRPEGGPQAAPDPFFPLQIGWTAELPAPAAAQPAFDGEHAYLALRDGTLVAVRLRDGSVAWNVRQPTALAPAAGGGTVVVAEATTLTALAAESGDPLWSFDLGAAPSTAPLRGAGWLIVALEGGVLVALDDAAGRELWRRDMGGAMPMPPAFGGRRLFVPIDDGRLAALNLFTGELLWEQPLTGSPRRVLPLDAVFVGTTGNYLYRLSLSSGRVDWRWRTGGDVVGAPVVDEERIYFASLDNMLWALDRDSGAQRWRQVLSRRPRAVPGLLGRLVLVTGVSEDLRSFDRETGEPSNTLTAPAELGAPPYVAPSLAAAGLRMVVLAADGRLIGMRRPVPPPAVSLAEPLPPLRPAPYTVLPATPIETGPVVIPPLPPAPDGVLPATPIGIGPLAIPPLPPPAQVAPP